MSRKTRKLIWSAPLVAVLAVAGVLAMFVVLEPGSVFANPLPGAPMNLEVNPASGNAGRTTLVLTWDAPAGGNVNGYRIDKADNGAVWETVSMNAGTGLTYSDITLTSEDTRWYRVFAVNDHGVSPVSNPSSGTTNEKGMPGSVRNFRAVADGRDKMDLSWDPPADNGGEKITGYEIQYHNGTIWVGLLEDDPAGDDYLEIPVTPSSDGTSHKDEIGLDPGEERNYQIRAINEVVVADALRGDRSEDWVSTAGTTAPAANPRGATGLTAVSASTTENGIVYLYWFAPEDTGGWEISHYVIQARRDIARKSWKKLPDVGDVTPDPAYDIGNIV